MIATCVGGEHAAAAAILRPVFRPSFVVAGLLAACQAPPPRPPDMLLARLGADGGDAARFDGLAAEFARRNPGHSLEWVPRAARLPAARAARIAFVQEGAARVSVHPANGFDVGGEVAVGDVVVLAPGTSMTLGAPVSLLVFALPNAPPASVPVLLRPDHDPRVTDTPGGCATDAAAYRRVLLTWLGKNGPYTFEGFNVHRVRIDDSFTHYHPVQGGFDEFYLVQAVRPGARILTSDRAAAIERPDSIAAAEVPGLLRATELRAGDLVYLPRGTAHRGLGGVLAQVITVPGFVPGAEIGLDHHLRAINARFALTGADALPFHAAAADGPVVK
jgi:hypothetical protein